MQAPVDTRRLEARDLDALASAFESWPKPRSLFERYVAEQGDDRRVVLIAWCDMDVCGYANVVWQPDGYIPDGRGASWRDRPVLAAKQWWTTTSCCISPSISIQFNW